MIAIPVRLRSTFRLLLTAAFATAALTLTLSFAKADGSATHAGLEPPGRQDHEATTQVPDDRLPRILSHGRDWVIGALTASAPISATLSDDPAVRGKIEPALLKRLLTAAPDERIPIIVEMRQQADWETALQNVP